MTGPVEIRARAEPVSLEKAVPPALGAVARRFGIEPRCERIHFQIRDQELAVVCNWSKGKHGISVQGFTLTRKVSPRPTILLRREAEIDRSGKSMGLNREVQTGDPTFDGYVYIESSAGSPALLETLGVPAVRQAALELLARDAAKVVLGPAVVEATFLRSIDGAAELDPDVVLATLEPFARLLEALPRATLEVPRGDGSTRGGCLSILVVLGSLVLAWAAYGTTWGLRDSTGLVGYWPFVAGAGFGVALAAVGVLLAFVSVRLRPGSTGYRQFIARSVWAVLVLLPLGTPALQLVDRATLSRTPVRVVETHIVDYSVSEGEWELEVADWDRAGGTTVFEVPSYPGVSTGGRLRLTVRQGVLRFRWVTAYEVLGR